MLGVNVVETLAGKPSKEIEYWYTPYVLLNKNYNVVA